MRLRKQSYPYLLTPTLTVVRRPAFYEQTDYDYHGACWQKRLILFYRGHIPGASHHKFYRVPRDHFERQSDVFRDMFQLPVPAGKLPDGSSDERPLLLEGIRKEDFQQILRIAILAYRRISHSLSGYPCSICRHYGTWKN